MKQQEKYIIISKAFKKLYAMKNLDNILKDYIRVEVESELATYQIIPFTYLVLFKKTIDEKDETVTWQFEDIS